MRRERKERVKRKKRKKRENYKLIHTDKQTDGQADKRTGRQAKIIHWYEILY